MLVMALCPQYACLVLVSRSQFKSRPCLVVRTCGELHQSVANLRGTGLALAPAPAFSDNWPCTKCVVYCSDAESA